MVWLLLFSVPNAIVLVHAEGRRAHLKSSMQFLYNVFRTIADLRTLRFVLERSVATL